MLPVILFSTKECAHAILTEDQGISTADKDIPKTCSDSDEGDSVNTPVWCHLSRFTNSWHVYDESPGQSSLLCGYFFCVVILICWRIIRLSLRDFAFQLYSSGETIDLQILNNN
jgi:hypothetical protein